MWNKRSQLMYLRVRVMNARHHIRFRMIYALYVLHQLFMSVEGLAGLIPGKAGMYLRTGLDSMHSMVLAIMQLPPNEYVNVSLDSGKEQVLVRVKSLGWGDEGR